MKKIILLSFFFSLFLQAQNKDSLFLRLVLPGSDTIKYGASRHRISACTTPNARAFINDKEVKVYASGAFVGMANVNVGTNNIKILVRSANGDSLVRNLIINRPEGAKTSPKDPITIESISQPSEDMWLTSGDVLEVRMKGSPGEQPVFDIDGVESGIPMRELDPKFTGGIEGIYIGSYKIRAEDKCVDVPVRFRIKKNFFSSEKAFSKGKFSIINDSLPRVAEITGKRPFLNFGLGDDRLGGAKLGFISPGIRVIVTGKVGDQYRVRLSESMNAWLPVEYAQFLPPIAFLPRTLSGTISAAGNDSVDIVSVSLGQKVPYTSEQLTNPTALVVNIFAATSNTNWITHYLSSAAGIQQVKSSQVATDHYQVTIYLSHKQHWGHDISYDGSTMKIKIRRAPIVADTTKPLANLTIAIDAGHGIGSQGALGATGSIEKDINLAIAKELNQQLREKGIRTVMTRETDSNVTMTNRADIVINSNAQLFVSIHNNSIGESSDAEQVKGTSTYYRYPGFKPLADIMYEKLLSLGLAEWGVTGSFNFSLSGFTQMPNVLCEVAFMSHPEDEMKLIDPNFRKQTAAKIIEGLENFVLTYKR